MRALRPGATFDTDRLPTPAEAIAAYLRVVAPRPIGTESVTLEAALGRVLARDAVAETHYPGDDRSTMDGFAVRSADGAARRRIVATIRMGHAAPAALGGGEAMRIPTGGVLPTGADTVVPLEDAEEQDGWVTPRAAPGARA